MSNFRLALHAWLLLGVLAGGADPAHAQWIFLSSVEGKITVLKAGRQWEVLGVDDIGEEIHATPALSGGRIYVRTRGALHCFAAPKS